MKTKIIHCRKCGSQNFKCCEKYSTNGTNLEWMEYTHICNECGYNEEGEKECHYYGYNGQYNCTICNRLINLVKK
jgi:hypothetical protein